MKKEYLECAKIISAHGVRGALKLESYCDSVKVLTSQKRVFVLENGEYKERKVINSSGLGEYAIMSIEGIETREAAQAAKGVILYLHRSDIPVKKGDMLIADMIGLPVFDFESGVEYGKIKDVSDAARGKIYTIETSDGKEVLFPSNREFVKEIDGDRGMFIRTIPGFFD